MFEATHQIHSVHLANERAIWIRQPPTGATRLVVVLDAELYRERVDASEVIDGLEAAGEIAPAWFVFVSVSSWAARWIECPCHPPFARFVADELLPWLVRLHPALASVEERTVVGLSYTGLAAAYLALEAPGVFGRVIAQSGSFWWNDCWLPARFAELTSPLPTGFFLDVGRRETAENVRHRPDVLQVVSQVEGVRRFEAALRQTGHEVVRVDFDGGHDPAMWKLSLPGALRWALPPAR